MSTAPKEDPKPPVAPGDLIANKYRIERALGAGGMAFVFAARHEDLGQLVAIKFLRPDLPDYEIAAGRFLREASAAARIQSDHVARVFDVGRTEGGHPYMVMEHFEGSDLDELLLSGGPMAIGDAVDHTLEALSAIAHAHALGVVHRDLKPANLFLASMPDGSSRIKVLDFGISKASGLDAPIAPGMVTSPNALLGSPAYMSPEQARSSTTVDLRTDLWSIGVILFELLTGRHPFQGETASKMLASIARDPPTPMTSLRTDVPTALERIILRCLERDLDARYQNAAELARALAPFASERTKALPARIALVLGAAPPPKPSSSSAVSPSMIVDEATADTLRSDDVASGPAAPAIPPAPAVRALPASTPPPPMTAPNPIMTAPPRTSPDPGTPSLSASTRDTPKDSSRAPREKSEAKGRLIALSLIAVAMLAVGMIAASAWQAAGRAAAQMEPQRPAAGAPPASGVPILSNSSTPSAAPTAAPSQSTSALPAPSRAP